MLLLEITVGNIIIIFIVIIILVIIIILLLDITAGNLIFLVVMLSRNQKGHHHHLHSFHVCWQAFMRETYKTVPKLGRSVRTAKHSDVQTHQGLQS